VRFAFKLSEMFQGKCPGLSVPVFPIDGFLDQSMREERRLFVVAVIVVKCSIGESFEELGIPSGIEEEPWEFACLGVDQFIFVEEFKPEFSLWSEVSLATVVMVDFPLAVVRLEAVV